MVIMHDLLSTTLVPAVFLKILILIHTYLLHTILQSMPTSFDLIINSGNFTFQYITMCFAAVITTFLVTMGA